MDFKESYIKNNKLIGEKEWHKKISKLKTKWKSDNKNLTNPLAKARGINREIFGIEKFHTKVLENQRFSKMLRNSVPDTEKKLSFFECSGMLLSIPDMRGIRPVKFFNKKRILNTR